MTGQHGDRRGGPTGPMFPDRCAGCGEPGMEAGPGGQADAAGNPVGNITCRAPPGRGPRAAQHDGSGSAAPRGCSLAGTMRDPGRAPRHGRAAQTIRRDAFRSGHPLRPGRGHPLLGRRIPDLDLVTDDGRLRVFTLLHDARPVLLNLGEPGGFDVASWADRVPWIDATYVGTWELSGPGSGHRPNGRADSARWMCGVGGRPDSAGACRRDYDLVRTSLIPLRPRVCPSDPDPTHQGRAGDAPRGIRVGVTLNHHSATIRFGTQHNHAMTG